MTEPLWIFPPIVQVEPTNCCNLNCTMCPRRNMTYPQGLMEVDLFRKIVDEISSKRVFVPVIGLKCFFLGEPLIHPRLREMIEYAAAKSLRVSIATNGFLLNAENSAWLLKNCWELCVSMDGMDAETYEQLRLNSDYGRVTYRLKLLCALKRTLNSPCAVRLVTIIPDDDAEASKWLTAMLYYWKDVDLMIHAIPYHAHPNTSWLGKSSTISKVERTRPCEDGLSQLVVRWDGETTFCCGDINTQVSLGNVKNTTLQKMWTSEKLWKIREQILALDYQKISSCRKCIVVPKNSDRILSVPFHLRKNIYGWVDKPKG